ncbi:hypothetical protein DXG01_004410 [Tephrocybe rancida]|nr:hypothetical protein DXG01_004410 [Tephrocybe rancida]
MDREFRGFVFDTAVGQIAPLNGRCTTPSVRRRTREAARICDNHYRVNLTKFTGNLPKGVSYLVNSNLLKRLKRQNEMPPSHEDSASSDEEDAPESVSLAQSKRNIKRSDDALHKAHAAEKEKKRLQNKERDRRLKEQAENSKRKRKEEVESDVDLQARMERAMQEAAEEMDEDGSSGEHGETDDEDEEFKGIDVDSDQYSGEDDNSVADLDNDDEEMDSDEEPVTKSNPNHLPDHLFTSAFASTTSKATSKRKVNQDPPTRKPRKRTRSQATQKDVLIGSRTIRTLTPGSFAGTSTLPSVKAKKFLDRSLGLKGPSAKKRGWERRPVNLGVMRRDGPAAHFVRNP